MHAVSLTSRSESAVAPRGVDWACVGAAALKAGNLGGAQQAFERALCTDADSIVAQSQLGYIKSKVSGFAAAMPHFSRLVELQPECARHWANLGICLAQQSQLPAALACFDYALACDPELGLAHAGRAMTLDRSLRGSEALANYDEAVRLNPLDFESHSNRLLCSQRVGGRTEENLFQLAREFGCAAEHAAAIRRASRVITAPDPERPLRVAFLSPDLRRHSVAYFLEPLLANLDPGEFSISLYHDHFQTDVVSERLRVLADKWYHVAGLSNDALHALLETSAPDIVIELAGHSGHNRLPLLARRLAPIQISYLGYPGTTGLATMDYRFVDPITDPEGNADLFHTEDLVRFAPCAWAYSPPPDAPDVAPPPSANGQPITFGCFNNFAKVSDGIIATWARLLSAAPKSQLLLKAAGLENPVLLDHVKKRFVAAGVDLARVIFLGPISDEASHLAAYAQVDVALDAFPYHGTTTTCEALWQGVPVVTLAGDSHASRVGASLLTAVGHPEWIATDADDYVRRAVALARSTGDLKTIRAELRGAMTRSVLMDHRGQAARFGAALRQTWRKLCLPEDLSPPSSAFFSHRNLISA